MPAFDLAYRLRIRNASTVSNPDGTADALVLSLADPPSGDGQSVDPLTGEFVAGSYTVEVIDTPTGTDGTGTVRTLTNALEDATLRQQLLSRRAYLELSEDGGDTWTVVLCAGYVMGIRLVDALTFAIEIGDARRIEQVHRCFTWSNVPGPIEVSERDRFPKRGCLLGGPIIGGLGPLTDAGGWEMTVHTEEADPADASLSFLRLTFVAGYAPPFFRRVRDRQPLEEYAELVLGGYRQAYTGIANFSASAFDALEEETTWFPDLTVTLSDGTDTWTGTLFAFGNGRWFVRLDAASSVTPPSGAVRMRVYTSEVSAASPLYVDAHPVDIVTDLYDTVGISWDTTTAAAVKAALGLGLRYTLRIAEPPMMADFLRDAVFGPFGFSIRNGADGEREFYLTRRTGTAAPVETISTDDVPEDEIPSVFELEEASVVTAFRVKYQTLITVNTPSPVRTARRRGTWPPDGVDTKDVTVIAENPDATVFSTREVAYQLPGMVRDEASFSPAMAPLITGIVREGFDRYGRGAVMGQAFVLLGTPAADKQIGEEVNVDLAHLPSRGYRLGESSVVARIMQVIQRTPVPEGAMLRLLDSGVDLQPVTPAATISIAASGANARTLAKFTITNAADINTAAVLTTVVEWATGASAPSGNGQVYARYAPGEVPTGAVVLPPVAPGTVVHVRARTEQPYRRASAWTSWQSHTLTAFSAPTSVAAGMLTGESAVVTWTPGAGLLPVVVYLYPGSSAPGTGTAEDWAPYEITVLRAGSSRTVLRGLTAATDYTVGIAHRDPSTGGVSNIVTDGFTTTSTSSAASPLRGFAVIPVAEDASYRTGVALACYAANDQHAIVIDRAPDSSGSPGTWAELVRLQGGSQVYVDELPSDGATWWYRARHETPGLDASDWSTAVEAQAGGVPDDIQLPAPAAASLTVRVAIGEEDAVITFAGYNVEMAVDGGAYSAAPSSPLTVERGAVLGGVDVTYSFRSIGTLSDDIKTVTAVVPKRGYSEAGGSDPSIDSISYANGDTPGDGGGEVDVSWTVSNAPGGATYDVEWVVTGGADISAGMGIETGVSSGFTLEAPMGTGATLRVRVKMRSGGVTVVEKTFESAVPI